MLRNMAIAIVVGTAGLAGADEWFPLEEGNRWVYATDGDGELVTRVTGFEDVNGVRCAVLETTPPGGSVRREWLAWDKEGLKLHRFHDGRMQVEPGTPVLRLKLPLVEGAEWTSGFSLPDGQVRNRYRLALNQSVEAGGKRYECVKVHIRSQNPMGDFTSEVHYARGTGLVRQSFAFEQGNATQVLKSASVRTRAGGAEAPAAPPAAADACPQCRAKAAPGARFCGECGARLAASAPAAPRPGEEGLRSPAAGGFEFRERGVSLRVPGGWRARTDPESGQIVVSGPAGEELVIWPCFVPGGLSAPLATTVLGKLSRQLRPEMGWGTPERLGGAALRARARARGRAAVASLAWVDAPQGSAAWFQLASAPEAGFRGAQDSFASILESLRLSGQTGGGGSRGVPGQLQTTRFRDPSENAFELEVPAGWRVEGGLRRRSAVDLKSVVRVTAPDAPVTVFIGDAEIPPFILPTQTLEWTGFREGSWYSPGYGTKMMVRRLLSGAQFAEEYARTRMGDTELNVTERRGRPDLSEGVNRISAQYAVAGIQSRLDCGEVAFTGRGGAVAGYVFAGCQATLAGEALGGGGTWTVEYLYGFAAPRERAAEAQAVLGRMIATVRVNPEWVRMQQGLTGAVADIVSKTGSFVGEQISRSYWNRQESQDRVARERSRTILGVEDLRDAETGEDHRVESGSNYYWIDHRGTIVGTDIHEQPNIDFRQLTRIE